MMPPAPLPARRALFAALVALAFAFALSCSKPQPPQLTPQSATVLAVRPTGIDVRVQLDAYNPNRIPLAAQSVQAKLTLAHQYDVANVTVPSAVSMPAQQHTTLATDLSLP